VQQLHLVGFTTDHRGLIFSLRRGAKSGGYVVHLDAPLMTAVDDLRALVAEENAVVESEPEPAIRAESTLSVREVQARLRRGRTIEQVAREAGVEASWIARFAVPVLAEQAEIIRAARTAKMTRQRVGPSGVPLGDAVYRNIADRGVLESRDELDKAWRARQLNEGIWLVTFTYPYRGKPTEAAWEYDTELATVRARGRLGATLGFRETSRRVAAPTPPRATTRAPAKKPAAKTATAKKKPTATKATKKTKSSRSGAPVKTSAATRRVAAARRAATARMVSEVERATRKHAAIARKSATKPVVVPPRRVDPEPELAVARVPDDAVELVEEIEVEEIEVDAVEEPTVEPLLDDVEAEEPSGWADDLELAWDDEKIAIDDRGVLRREFDEEPEPEAEVDGEVEVEADELDEDDEFADDEEVQVEEAFDEELDEPEPEPPVAPHLEIPAAHPKRREPLRANRRARVEPAVVQIDDYAAGQTDYGRVRVRVRPQPLSDDAGSGGNGPVFHSDLTKTAAELSPYHAPDLNPGSPTDPLTIPEPIEPLPRRWRRKPSRRR